MSTPRFGFLDGGNISPTSGAGLGDDYIRDLRDRLEAVGALIDDPRFTDDRTPLNGSVTLAKLAAALKPSAGAGPAAEAVRALGTTADTAAAGNDARLSDQRVPVDGTVSTAKLVDGAVTTAKIGNGQVTPVKRSAAIADSAVTGGGVVAWPGSGGTLLQIPSIGNGGARPILVTFVVRYFNATGAGQTPGVQLRRGGAGGTVLQTVGQTVANGTNGETTLFGTYLDETPGANQGYTLTVTTGGDGSGSSYIPAGSGSTLVAVEQ